MALNINFQVALNNMTNKLQKRGINCSHSRRRPFAWKWVWMKKYSRHHGHYNHYNYCICWIVRSFSLLPLPTINNNHKRSIHVGLSNPSTFCRERISQRIGKGSVGAFQNPTNWTSKWLRTIKRFFPLQHFQNSSLPLPSGLWWRSIATAVCKKFTSSLQKNVEGRKKLCENGSRENVVSYLRLHAMSVIQHKESQ